MKQLQSDEKFTSVDKCYLGDTKLCFLNGLDIARELHY